MVIWLVAVVIVLMCLMYTLGYSDGIKRATGKFVPRSARKTHHASASKP